MKTIQNLLDVMAALRDPASGCPWDLEQSFASIAPYTIEEAYEVADAIDRADLPALKDELGDLLLQVVFHAQMASEQDAFDFDAVAAGIVAKMVRRHPHVFGEQSLDSADAQSEAWEAHKRDERAAAGETAVLAGVSQGLPALLRAHKLSKRAARVGFDWPEPEGSRDKILEELDELAEARSRGNREDIAEEMGDLLFAAANLSRKLGVNPEEALRRANRKFETRFAAVEAAVQQRGGDWNAFSLDQLEVFWAEAKQAARAR